MYGTAGGTFSFQSSLVGFLSVENVALEYRNITVGDAMIYEPVWNDLFLKAGSSYHICRSSISSISNYFVRVYLRRIKKKQIHPYRLTQKSKSTSVLRQKNLRIYLFNCWKAITHQLMQKLLNIMWSLICGTSLVNMRTMHHIQYSCRHEPLTCLFTISAKD